MGAWGKRDDMVVHEADPYNAEPPRTALAGQALTPVESFYSRNHGPIPEIDLLAWRLHVDGLVDRPLDLSLADLRNSFPPRTEVATLQCAGNRRAGLIEVRDIPGRLAARRPAAALRRLDPQRKGHGPRGAARLGHER
jgi:sulfite oxidase